MTSAIEVDGTPTDGWSPWIDSLVSGGAWSDTGRGDEDDDDDDDDDDGDDQVGTLTVGYSFEEGFFSAGTLGFGFEWFPAEQEAFKTAFAMYEAVADITFVEAKPDLAEIHYFVTNEGYFGRLLGDIEEEGIHETPAYPVFGDHGELYGVFNYEAAGWTPEGLVTGGQGFNTIVRQIGFGLGLATPHEGGAAPDASTFPGVEAEEGDLGQYELNQGVYTVMSGNGPWSELPTSREGFGWIGGPMALDIYALQLLYGANTTYATGDNTYTLPSANAAGTFWSSIWDAGGEDTISNAGSARDAVIDLRQAEITGPNAGGYLSNADGILGGFTIASGAEIENAVGGEGNDVIIGNEFDNELFGGGGNDTIYGLAGDDLLDGGTERDRLFGGVGNDTYHAAAEDQIEENANEGTDLVIAQGTTFTLSSHLENLQFDESLQGAEVVGRGNGLNNQISGSAGGSRLIGRGGDDTLTGDLEVDTLKGNGGDDTLFGRAGNDKLVGGGGNDALLGESGDDELNGGGGRDDLDGGSGSDTLKGGGGRDILTGQTGNDTLSGGGGNDDLDGGESDDTLDGGTGDDSLMGGTGDDDLKGGSGDDTLDGSSGSDTLNGGGGDDMLDGGTGDDRMVGGGGDDKYFVDNTGDEIVEKLGGGNDTAVSMIAFYQLDNQVENLRFKFDEVPEAITGFGNGLNNRITGLDGAEALLRGAGGDDVLTGGNRADRLEGEGGDDRLRGLEGRDELLGGNGRDELIGGAGADTLTGGGGADDFIYRSDDGNDTITDFQQGTDLIVIESGARRFNQLEIEAVGDNVEISFANTVITVLNADVDDFTRADFLFL